MFFTLAAVVFFAAIMTFFSQELISAFKKIMAIKGAKVVLPLLIASLLVEHFKYWALYAIYNLSELLHTCVRGVAYILPLGFLTHYIAYILVLTLCAVIPLLVLDLVYKNEYKPYPHRYVISAMIWLVCMLTLILT